MSMEVMEQLSAAEDRAEGIRHQAALEAREVLKNTDEAVRAGERENAREIKEKTTQYLNEQEELAKADLTQIRLNGTKQREEQISTARAKLGKASAFIYGRIVENG